MMLSLVVAMGRVKWFVPLIVLAGCSSPEPPRAQRTASGKSYGGVFNVNELEELRSIFPLGLTQAAAHRIGAQVYDGLVRLDQRDLSVMPALAESWTADATATEYTFTLRKGVFFHDDPCFADGRGREMKAEDVVHCFDRICTNDPGNQMFWLFQDRIVGANAHFAGEDRGEHVKGVEALDDRTVRIKLTTPWPGFMEALAHQGCWIYPKELVDHYGEDAAFHPVGTGAFKLRNAVKNEIMVLERNPNYWRKDNEGNPLPYLDAVRYTFVQDKEKAFGAFEGGSLSVCYEVPVGMVAQLEEDHTYTVQATPQYSVQFYGMNRMRAPFNDEHVRRAISMAIDRRYLVDSVLQGLAYVADRGVVPPGFEEYPYGEVNAPGHDAEAARRLLAEAGYPGGRGLPPIVLLVNNDRVGYIEVAEALQTMLARELGVELVLSVLPTQQHYETVAKGEATFWREAWVADYPDPENFLSLFYGKNVPLDSTAPSYLNSTRYQDAKFDDYFTKALRTTDTKERMHLLAQAESNLMENSVVIPMYHERSVRLLQPWVRDLPINAMEYIDLAVVWFDPAAMKP